MRIGSFVACTYDEKWWLGMVAQISDEFGDHLDTLTRWSDVWLLKFHPEKCFHLSIGKNEEHESNYHMIIDNVKHDMTHIEEIKDIGVVVDKSLKFEKHINSKIETANKILGIISRT